MSCTSMWLLMGFRVVEGLAVACKPICVWTLIKRSPCAHLQWSVEGSPCAHLQWSVEGSVGEEDKAQEVSKIKFQNLI